MRGLKTGLMISGAAAAAFGLALASAQSQPVGNGVFTADQVTIGATTYQTVCAKCHQPDMRGGSEAPPLAGAGFMNSWRARNTRDLYTKIATSMPADNPRTLSDQAVGALVAYILRQNGANPGGATLTAERRLETKTPARRLAFSLNLGRPCWARTSDQRIKSPLLYQLS